LQNPFWYFLRRRLAEFESLPFLSLLGSRMGANPTHRKSRRMSGDGVINNVDPAQDSSRLYVYRDQHLHKKDLKLTPI